MKNLKYKTTILFMLCMLIVTSCKKEFFTDANINPNEPPSVTPSSLLTVCEGAVAYNQGGTFGIFTSIFTQQVNGVGQQAAAYNKYTVTAQDLDDPWSTWYTNALSGCKDLMTQADAKGYNAYGGVARLLMAYSYMLMVDAWGDIPYSQALQGIANIQPSYDNAASIYAGLNGLVDEGIAKLSGDLGPVVPGDEDVIYGGDATLWVKFGHAIKARLAIHQSKSNASMATTALSEIALSFASNAESAIYPFSGASEVSSNPWYQFNVERPSYVSYSSSTLAGILTSLNDPRYSIYIDSANDAAGNGLGAYYGAGNSPIELITYDELLFMTAEAQLRASNPGAAQTAFTDAITANFDKLGVSGTDLTTYLAAHGTLPGTQADAIDTVGVQTYLALYLNPEAWTTWRRTNSPTLVAVAGSNGVPRRLLYVQTEIFYNAVNTPKNSTLWAPRLFWDN